MREILFRGKCPDTGRWYEGQYIHLHKTTFCFKEDYDRYPDNDIHQIVFERMTDWGLPNQHFRADVLPETVGQFTGRVDMKRKRIFEGDVCRFHNDDGETTDSLVCWDETESQWQIRCIDHGGKDVLDSFYAERCEIVGNVHDNPELLEVSSNGV